MVIPGPEMSLLSHESPARVFYESVHLARRWCGPDALEARVINQTSASDALQPHAVKKAGELAPLAVNKKQFSVQKEEIFGARSTSNNTNGAAFHLRNKNLSAQRLRLIVLTFDAGIAAVWWQL